MGIIVRSLVAPLSASGMVRIRTFANETTSLLAAVDLTTYNCDDYLDIPLNNCHETAVVVRRLDETSKYWKTVAEFDVNNNITNTSNTGFGQVMVSIDGGPLSLPVLDIEYVLHWEVRVTDSDNLAQIQTPPPPFNPTVNNATAVMQSTAVSIFDKGVSQVSKYVEKKAAQALASLLGV